MRCFFSYNDTTFFPLLIHCIFVLCWRCISFVCPRRRTRPPPRPPPGGWTPQTPPLPPHRAPALSRTAPPRALGQRVRPPTWIENTHKKNPKTHKLRKWFLFFVCNTNNLFDVIFFPRLRCPEFHFQKLSVCLFLFAFTTSILQVTGWTRSPSSPRGSPGPTATKRSPSPPRSSSLMVCGVCSFGPRSAFEYVFDLI